MNIFFVDEHPDIAAKSLHNKHIHKMALEGLQLLANCFSDDVLSEAPKTKKGTPWQHSHYNHPMAIWVRQSPKNFVWLLEHIQNLILEYNKRYNKASSLIPFCTWICQNCDRTNNINDVDFFTSPPQCMPNHLKVYNGSSSQFKNTIAAYRNYYVTEKFQWFSESRNKNYFNKWPNIESVPNWFLVCFPQEQWKNFVK